MNRRGIEVVPLNEITVEERFRVDLGEVDDLSENIKEHGLIQPVTVDQNYRLLAGGRRLAACEKAGLTTIEAIVQRVEGDADRFEIELFENLYRKDLHWAERARLEMRIYKERGGSQADLAKVTFQSVGAVNRHLQLAEALELIPELEKCKTEDEAWKMMKKAQESLALKELLKRVEKGDLGEPSGDDDPADARVRTTAFRHADTNYLIGDALNEMKGIAPGTFQFAEVDPPYAIDIIRGKKSAGPASEMAEYNEIPHGEYPSFVNLAAKEVHRILADNTFCVWWFAFEHYQTVYEILQGVGFYVNPIPAVWIKGSGQAQQPQAHLASSYEPFFICRKGLPAMRKAGRINVFDYKPVNPREKIHPTERPIQLMQEILTTFAYPAMFIICPFLGSGATLRAAYRENMAGCGWDKSEEYKAKFLLRIEDDIKSGILGE